MGKYRNEIKITDVMSLLSISVVRATGNERFFSCPHCGGKKGNEKCSANISKNNYHCFRCDNGGGPVELYMVKTGFSGSKHEAWQKLRKDLSDGNFPEDVVPFMEQLPEETKTSTRASDAEIDKTYRTMLAALPLQDEHKNDLLRRLLTDSEIREGLFSSMPTDRLGICRKLIKNGCRLEGVPGFFVNRSGEWELYGRPGYCCPAFQDGKIVGIQIRTDVPVHGCKYVWMSSPAKLKGTPSGSPVTFFGDPNAEAVIITEGILKAYITYQFLDQKTAVIGVAGVSAVKSCIPLLKNHRHKIVWESYDMDKCMEVKSADDQRKKDTIRKALDKLNQVCQKEGLKVAACYWDIDPKTGFWKGHYKGIDDYLAATRRLY